MTDVPELFLCIVAHRIGSRSAGGCPEECSRHRKATIGAQPPTHPSQARGWGGGDPETRVRKAGGCCGDGGGGPGGAGGGVEWWRVGGGIVQFQRKQQRLVPMAAWGGIVNPRGTCNKDWFRRQLHNSRLSCISAERPARRSTSASSNQ